MPFNLFGKKEKPVDAQEAITKLRDSEEMLEKKSRHLETQIEKELQSAKTHGTKNKRAALNALKRKKRLEAQLKVCYEINRKILKFAQCLPITFYSTFSFKSTTP